MKIPSADVINSHAHVAIIETANGHSLMFSLPFGKQSFVALKQKVAMT
jgi:hypothetical protein